MENREKWRKLVAKSSVVPRTTLAVKGLMMMMMVRFPAEVILISASMVPLGGISETWR